MQVHNNIKHFFTGLTAVMLICLTGCSSSVEVAGKFPKPVTNQYPFKIGVIYDDAFKQYEYIEQDEDRVQWQIAIGKAQVELFNTVLAGMFAELHKAPGVSDQGVPIATDEKVDLYFRPTVEEFQYNVPLETKVDMFEVWIKYHLRVYDQDGKLLADWIQTAYGKTPTETFQTEKGALNDAMVVALRDIGASVVLRFPHIPEIKAWLSKQKKA